MFRASCHGGRLKWCLTRDGKFSSLPHVGSVASRPLQRVGDFPWSLVFVLSGGLCFKAEARTGKGLCSYSFGEGLVMGQTWQPQRPADVVRSRVAACRLRVS